MSSPRALLYLRKSTEEHQADSIHTQREGAEGFVRKLGGNVVGEIVDEDESRAEFKRRPGFARLLALCSSKDRDFDVLVVRDESRLGAGERLTVALDDVLAAGVRVFYYASAEEVDLSSPEHKLTHAVRAIVADMERAKTAGRTREALERKARRGWNVGGRCFGYDNVRTEDADGRGHTDYRVNAEEARVVLECCRRYAAGESERAIARDLNSRGVPPPRAGGRGTGSWSPSCVREIIRRPRYRGSVEWGLAGAVYRGGTRVTFTRKRAELVTVDRPEMRIVPAELDEAIRARIADVRHRTGGRNDFEGRTPRYLLSGKAVSRCGVCGGPMQVANGRQGRRTIRVYVCAWHRDRGPAVCANAVRRPVDAVDRVFIDWVRDHVLTEGLVVAALAEVRRRLRDRAASSTSDRAMTEAEVGRLDREIRRLVSVAASLDEADKPEELGRQIEEKTRRRRELRARLDADRAAPAAIDREVRGMEEAARARLADLRALLGRNPTEARRAVEALLRGPITFTPTSAGAPRFELSGEISTGGFFRFCNPGVPSGIRTRVAGLKGRGPGPLDDGDSSWAQQGSNLRPSD
jgi:site-specific DNA recombinase